MHAEDASETLVLGVGSVLCGDDGVGIRAAEMLGEQVLPPRARVEAVGTPGFGLAAWLEGQARIIIIDAVRMGTPPGTWRRFEPQAVRLIASGQILSLHAPGVADGLALAQALDRLPGEVVIYGLEPATCAAGAGLSSAVEQALPGMIAAILAELWKRES